MDSNGQSPVGSLVSATQAWIHQPFAQPVSLFDLFLITGAVMAFAFLWTRILAHVE